MAKEPDSLFSKFLTSEQLAALKEEIASGIRTVNNAVEADKRLKARKESLKELIRKLDAILESDSTPLFAKILYKTLKVQAIETIEKIINENTEPPQKEQAAPLPKKEK